jgi:hypothetical protein
LQISTGQGGGDVSEIDGMRTRAEELYTTIQSEAVMVLQALVKGLCMRIFERD